MIGTFLVFVAAICALLRCWWDRLEYYLYKTEIGDKVNVRVDSKIGGVREVVFVQYFLRGREFWWWDTYAPSEWEGDEWTDASLSDLLAQPLPRHRGHKVQNACLFTVDDEVDVTKMFQQLSGPRQDFRYYKRQLDVDVVQAYLHARLAGETARYSDWLYVNLRVVPGSVAPFKPLRFEFREHYVERKPRC